MERRPFLSEWPPGESLVIDHPATLDHDMVTIIWRAQEGEKTEGYVRIGALDDSTRKAVFKSLAAGPPPPPDPVEHIEGYSLDLPFMGVTYVLGGAGPAIISLHTGTLVIKTDDVNGTRLAEYIPIKSLRRSTAGISFIDVKDRQHVFTFVDRPVGYIPPQWEAIPTDHEITF